MTNIFSMNRFWLYSILLHLLALCLLILTPARQIFMPEKEPPEQPKITKKDRELEEIIEKIRLSEARALQARVALLREGANRMEDNKETFAGKFREYEETQKGAALERLDGFEATVLRLAEEQKTVFEEAAKSPKDRSQWEEIYAASERFSSQLLDNMQNYRRALVFLDVDEELVEQQEALEESQFSINQHLTWMRQGMDGYRNRMEAIPDLKAELAKRKEELETLLKENPESRRVEQAKKRVDREAEALAGNEESRSKAVERVSEQIGLLKQFSAPFYYKQRDLVESIQNSLQKPNPTKTDT